MITMLPGPASGEMYAATAETFDSQQATTAQTRRAASEKITKIILWPAAS